MESDCRTQGEIMSIEAMKQALEALELLERYDNQRAMLTDDAIEGVWQIADEAITALRAAIEQAEQGQWDAIPDAFNEWWNADYDDSTNPFRLNSPAYWAWAGWSAANKEKNR
jgi:hypothetical protein